MPTVKWGNFATFSHTSQNIEKLSDTMELVGNFSLHYSIPLNLCTYIFIPYARKHWIIGC